MTNLLWLSKKEYKPRAKILGEHRAAAPQLMPVLNSGAGEGLSTGYRLHQGKPTLQAGSLHFFSAAILGSS